jgi:hypothetical protein
MRRVKRRCAPPWTRSSTVTIIDEVPGRGRHVAFKLELWSEKITARELIERRVRHEVAF